MPEGFDGETLRYPLYLDVPMMVSFLATLQDGVSFEEKVQTRTGNKRQSSVVGEGGTKVPSIPGLSSLLSFDLRGKLSVDHGNEQSEELEMVRQHTEASLFNRLRNVLHDPSIDAIMRLGDDVTQWNSLRIGELVEVTGEVIRNPLVEILAFYSRLMEPVMQPQQEESRKKIALEQEELSKAAAVRATRKSAMNKASSQKVNQTSATFSGQQSVEMIEQLLSPEVLEAARKEALDKQLQELNQQEQLMQIVKVIRDDVRTAHMQDVLLQLSGSPANSCILTLTEDGGFDKRPLDDLLGAELVVLGKVTKILREGETVNLLRRSSLGFLSEAMGDELMQQLKQVQGLNLRLDQIQVKAPAIQVLPLAIFA